MEAGGHALCQGLFGGFVGRPFRELVCSADVGQVCVGEDDQRIPLEHAGDVPAQTGDAQARVHDEVAVRAAQPPQVGPHQRVDVRLGDANDAVVQFFQLVPAVSLRQGHRPAPVVTSWVARRLPMAPVTPAMKIFTVFMPVIPPGRTPAARDI